ncbi:hypothetical protein ACWIUH_07090 [Ursidibacter arcticus]
MAYAKTEHSRKLRIKTANAWNKKQLEEGKIKRMTLQFSTEDAERFDAVAKELGLSRPQTIMALCELYLQNRS